MSANFLDKLEGIIKLEKELYQDLFDLSLSKQQAILNRDIHKLSQMVKKEEELVAEMGKVEKDRLDILASLAKLWRLSTGKLTLKKIIELAPSSHTERLKRMGDSLLSTIMELAALNKVNERLIEDSLALTRLLLKTIVEGNAVVYGHQGEKKERGLNLLLNQQA
ncbi:MAG: flagellar protein FlgN [bacterium]